MRFLSLVLFGVLSSMQVQAQPEPTFAVRQTTLKSLVKVTATDCSDGVSRSGSGFALEKTGRIVTAHHVVGGCKVLQVRYEGVASGSPASRSAILTKVLPKADLALLSVESPPSVPVLKLAPPPPNQGNVYFGSGYQNGQNSASDLRVTFSAGKSQLADFLTRAILDELNKQSSIDTGREVLRFNIALQPGMSGGPIVDASGAVIGIVAGGLKAGAAPASWGWPAEWISELMLSTAPVNQKIGIGGVFYSSTELDEIRNEQVKGRTLHCGDLDFQYRGRQPFSGVVQGADDLPRVRYLMALSRMSMAELDALAFDIWVHEPSGATAVTPAGYSLISQSGVCVAKSPDGVFQQVIWGKAARNQTEIQMVSGEFESTVMGPRVPHFTYWVDAQLTTSTMGVPGPIFRENGMVFNRKGFSHSKEPYLGGPVPLAHSFETLIAKAGSFMGVGIVNEKQHEQLAECLQTGIRSEPCLAARTHLNVWTHFVLATQLSTYPVY